jgi:hypothetical protein
VVLLSYEEGPEPNDPWGELALSPKHEATASPPCAACLTHPPSRTALGEIPTSRSPVGANPPPPRVSLTIAAGPPHWSRAPWHRRGDAPPSSRCRPLRGNKPTPSIFGMTALIRFIRYPFVSFNQSRRSTIQRPRFYEGSWTRAPCWWTWSIATCTWSTHFPIEK